MIDLNGDFIVRAPLKTSDNNIYKFIAQKAEWVISKRIQHIVDRKYKPLEFVEGEFAIKEHDDCSVLEDLLYEQGMIGVVVDETTLHPAEGAERSYTLYEWNDIPEHKYENYPSSEQEKADYVADWIGDDEDLF